MSSALSSPFMAESIAEVVPDVVKVAGKLAMSSVITGRRRVRLVPQSGQNYNSGSSSGIINILIQDGQAYADLLSATLSFDLTCTDTANAGTAAQLVAGTNLSVLDDGAFSVFRRALISVNSTLMDDTDFLPKKVNAEVYATASQNWYDNVGSWLGYWKHNTSAYGFAPSQAVGTADAFISKYNTPAKAVEFAKRVSVLSNGTTVIAGENHFAVPLSLLTGFFRNDTLFPSRNAGQLYVQLNIASAVEAMLCVGGATPAPQFTISNLTLELDFVDLHPTYLSLMDDLIESAGGAGVNWAFDAHLVATQALSAGTGTQSVIVSKASQNMRALQIVAQPSAGLSSPLWLSQSTFCNPGFIDVQYRVGSLYYPAFVARNEQRAYMDLQNAFGSPESIDKSGLIDTINYYASTAVPGAPIADINANQPAIAYNNNGVLVTATTGGATGLPVRSAWCDMWSYAYCFDRLKHAKFHGVELDGINTLTSSGSQMVVQLNCAPPVGYTLTSIARFTRILHLGGGATSVIG